MKNITVSVPDDVYRAARIAAAERGTSVSALVAEHLREVATADRHEGESLVRLLDEIRARNPNFSARDNVSRDELHDRDLR